MKTNKSYKKRLKVTKTGKIIARKKGQNHFNAKENGISTLLKRRPQQISMTPKTKSRFLKNVGNK
jgi:ribosomal protein L35